MKLFEAVPRRSGVLVKSTILSLIITGFIFAQQGNNQFDENQKIIIIEKVLDLIKENYVFPNKYYQIESEIRKKLSNKEYEVYNDSQEFLNYLNITLQMAAEDRHLKISFNPELVKQIKADRNVEKKEKLQESPSYTPELLAWIKFENYGLRKVEKMDGNIGYFKFDRFTDLSLAKKSIVGAMNFLNNSSAIILDLRDNGGGDGEASNFIINYFLPDNIKIGEIKFIKEDKPKEVIVKKDKDVEKFSDDVPVYILVSNKTASAAEAVAYVLQKFKRAVIIGEQTSGKGNPGELFVVNEFLYMMVPTGSFRVEPTGTNWEGTGVRPDIKIYQSKALLKAMIEICTQLENRDPYEEHKQIYKWLLPAYEAQLNPGAPSIDFINTIVGNYEDDRKIIFENQVPFYQSKSGEKKVLTYMKNQIFMLEGRDDVRIKFPVGEVTNKYFNFVYSDGFIEKIMMIE
jgi:hypothetical protein